MFRVMSLDIIKSGDSIHAKKDLEVNGKLFEIKGKNLKVMRVWLHNDFRHFDVMIDNRTNIAFNDNGMEDFFCIKHLVREDKLNKLL